MKTTLFLVISMLIAAFAFGQTERTEKTELIPPQFRYKDSKSINDFLKKNIDFSSTVPNYYREGTVVVEFVVNPNSKISDVKFLNGISPQVNSEVLRVLIASSGKWNPGYVNKKATPMKYEVALVFYRNSMEHLVQRVQNLQMKASEWLTVKNNPKKALKYFDYAISMLPFEESLWIERAMCKHELGDAEGESSDLSRFQLLTERRLTNSMVEQLAISTEN